MSEVSFFGRGMGGSDFFQMSQIRQLSFFTTMTYLPPEHLRVVLETTWAFGTFLWKLALHSLWNWRFENTLNWPLSVLLMIQFIYECEQASSWRPSIVGAVHRWRNHVFWSSPNKGSACGIPSKHTGQWPCHHSNWKLAVCKGKGNCLDFKLACLRKLRSSVSYVLEFICRNSLSYTCFASTSRSLQI